MNEPKSIQDVIHYLDSPFIFNPKFREYGVKIDDGGTSYIVLRHDPFNGKRLPDPLRERWFDELEALGLDPGEDGIPDEFNDERWWLNRKL